MMKILLKYLLLFVAVCASAQTVSKSIVASSGLEISDAEFKVNFTIGEPIVGLINGDGSIDQGFWAGSLFVEPITEEENLGGIVIYPNPVESQLNVIVNNNPVFGLSMFSVDGRMVYREKVDESQTQHLIDASMLAKGVYVLHVLVKGSTEVKLFKVIKN